MVSRRHLLRVAPLTAVGGCLGGLDGTGTTESSFPSRGEGETLQPTASPTPTSSPPPTDSPTATTPSTPTDSSTTADQPGANATSTPPPAATPSPTPATTVTVRIRRGAFEPRRLAVGPNTLVRWVNDDPDTHRIRSTRVGGSTSWDFSSPMFDRGEHAQFVFREPGAYAYFSPRWGRSTSCGLVRVGSVGFDGDLPCESGY